MVFHARSIHRPTVALGAVFLALHSTDTIARPPVPVGAEQIAVPETVVRQARAAVPEGWTVEAKGDLLLVRRKKPVEVVRHLPNGPADGRGEPPHTAEEYVLAFRFVPYLSEAGYERRLAEIARREQDLEALRAKLRHVTNKFDEYLPDTPEDKKLVAAYEVAKKQLSGLRPPDYFTETHGIEEKPPLSVFASLASEKERDECELVRARVTLPFERYGISAATRRVARSLKANPDTFEFTIQFHPGKDVVGKPSSLTFTTLAGQKDRAKDWPVVRIKPAVAVGIVDQLVAQNQLHEAVDLKRDPSKEPAGPCYTLGLSAGKDVRYRVNLGWGPGTAEALDKLAASLRSPMEEALGRLQGDLREQRKQWEKAAAVPSR
jgi:hypothetical protein